MKHVAVIGAGISGLTAAYRLQQAGVEATVFEAGPRVGGVVQTLYNEGCIMEGGPDSWISHKSSASDLCRELGLESELMGVAPEARRSLVLHKGILKPIPEGFFLMSPVSLRALWGTDVLSPLGKLRMGLELFVPRRRQAGDESLASFVRRRFGREALDRIAQPLVAGIYSADPEKLSLEATFPQFIEWERSQGSVIRALRSRKSIPSASDGQGSQAQERQRGPFTTLSGGMAVLTESLARSLRPGALHLNTKVSALRATAEGIDAHTMAGVSRFDAAIVALPAPATANVLSALDAALSGEFLGIETAAISVVNFVFRKGQLHRTWSAAGAVVPSVEKRPILAMSFSSNKFPGRAPDKLAVVRLFVRGAVGDSNSDPARVALAELRDLVGVSGKPLHTAVVTHGSGIPQYHIGHRDRVARIRSAAARFPRVAFCGNSFDGVGTSDCIRSATEAVRDLLERVGD